MTQKYINLPIAAFSVCLISYELIKYLTIIYFLIYTEWVVDLVECMHPKIKWVRRITNSSTGHFYLLRPANMINSVLIRHISFSVKTSIIGNT
jgi:hypothetical protein